MKGLALKTVATTALLFASNFVVQAQQVPSSPKQRQLETAQDLIRKLEMTMPHPPWFNCRGMSGDNIIITFYHNGGATLRFQKNEDPDLAAVAISGYLVRDTVFAVRFRDVPGPSRSGLVDHTYGIDVPSGTGIETLTMDGRTMPDAPIQCVLHQEGNFTGQ